MIPIGCRNTRILPTIDFPSIVDQCTDRTDQGGVSTRYQLMVRLTCTLFLKSPKIKVISELDERSILPLPLPEVWNGQRTRCATCTPPDVYGMDQYTFGPSGGPKYKYAFSTSAQGVEMKSRNDDISPISSRHARPRVR